MVVQLSLQLWGRLADYCRTSYPHEACGFMIGEMMDGGTGPIIAAADFAAVRNVAVRPEREFVMEPAELVAVLAKTPHERLLGIFHSHPTTLPAPSHRDLQTAWHTLPSYWIISLQNIHNPSLQVYRLQQKKDYTSLTVVFDQ